MAPSVVASPRRARRRAGPLACVIVAPLVAACSGGFAERTEAARSALDLGQPRAALAAVNEELGVDHEQQLPRELGGDAPLLLLDRAMILQSLGKLQLSSRDLEVADKQIELLDLGRNAGDDLGRYLFSDEAGRYRAPAFEKLMINTLNAANYLARGDLNGARVEARRLAVMQRFLASREDPQAVFLGAGAYFAGFAFERSGRPDEALRWYDEALRRGNYPSLGPAIARLFERSNVRSSRLVAAARGFVRSPATTAPSEGGTSVARPLEASPEPAELLVIFGSGRVPAKIAKRVPIGLALTYASGALSPGDASRANALAAQGLVTWVNYPELGRPRGTWDAPRAWIDRGPQDVEGLIALDSEAYAAWEDAKGAVMASAITRMLTRAVAGEVVRRSQNDGAVGLIASLFTQAALSAADTPDTRSWSTLPATLSVMRVEVVPGEHELVTEVRGRVQRRKLRFEPGGWAAVLVSELR
jgi:uncharacterized protein